MPQFDPSSFSPQLFWLAITFVALYILMAKVALPKIGDVLDERQRKIDDNLDKAATLKAEAETAVAAYEKALAESRAHAQAVIKETAERMAKQAEQRHKELNDRMAEQIKAGEARIAAAKDQALSHVREVAAEVAKAASGRLAGLSPDDTALSAAVTASMQEQR